jgi:hypothetical protein
VFKGPAMGHGHEPQGDFEMLKTTVLAAAVATMFTGSAFATSYGNDYGHGYDVTVYQPDYVITAYYDTYYDYDQWGEYCYTNMGLIGPGDSAPIGADCSVWTPYGEVWGTIAQPYDDWGYYCRTAYGDAGPAPVMLVGSWCIVNTSYGEIHGYVIGG